MSDSRSFPGPSEHVYDSLVPAGHRLEHRYGPNVHLLSDPWGLSAVARASRDDCPPFQLHALIRSCFRRLLQAAVEQLPSKQVQWATRMSPTEPRARYDGRVVDPDAQVVVVDVARGGMIPAHELQLGLFELLDPARVRVDHLFLQRVPDPQTGRVVDTAFHGSKIGGPIDGATLIVPDPMGATGGSLVKVFEHYRDDIHGEPAAVIACHLIVTPEYLARITQAFPKVRVYALRLDRGLSSPEVLATVPGTHWEQERGLDDNDYIVPGAGGLGEVLNNAWV